MSASRKSSKTDRGRSAHSLRGGSAEANRLAVAILEVLAGLRTPTDAAQVLGISLPRYYQLEVRALEGLVSACESRKKGRQLTPESRIRRLEEQLTQAQTECARQQALVRATQRTIGLKAPTAPAKSKARTVPGKRRRKRRPTVRALRAVRALQETISESTVDESTADLTDRNASSSTAGSTRNGRSPE